MAKLTKAPLTATVADILQPVPGLNDVVLRDADRQDFPAAEIPYNYTPDQGLASRRSKQVVRSCAEVQAACSGDLPLADGLSLRSPMAGQAENDQFPFSTDRYGKQRS